MSTFIDFRSACVTTPDTDSFARPVSATAYFDRKAPWMRFLGGVLLVCFAPLILFCGVLVRLTSRGPALYRQTRLGKHGRPFEILKIRTMTCDAETMSGAVLCTAGDARITSVGRALRFLHLDELPQLVNVMRGEMCLVGPRPERPEIIAKHRLDEFVPGFAERMHVLPGVTGLAQINLPADISAECVIPKVALDREYVATASVALDIRILACTALRMLGVRHGRVVDLFGVGRRIAVSKSPQTIVEPGSATFTGAPTHSRPSEVPRRVVRAAASSDSWSEGTDSSVCDGVERQHREPSTGRRRLRRPR